MESSRKYTLIVFNTCTREYEEVTVTEEVYHAYCRTRWNIKDNDESFFDHEIQMSGMIGSQDGAYENFREFIDTINVPDDIVFEQVEKEALYQAISVLPAADRDLVRALFFKGQSELEYAKELGISQPAVHKRKVRILKHILFDRFLKKYYADIDVSNERMTINLTDEEGHVLSFNLSQSEVHYVLHMVERRLNSFMRDDGGGGFSDED